MAEHDEHAPSQSARGLLSLRVIIEGLAVAGIIWLASSVQAQNAAIVRLQVQITQVQASLADVPRITRDVAQLQIQVAEHDRRLGAAELRLDQKH